MAASSSPPTRGSSARGASPHGDGRVVPAYAGVIPSMAGPVSLIRRRPRLRGGHPQYSESGVRNDRSSPPTRGSSRVLVGLPRDRRVVPAYAGVILPRDARSVGLGSRPRLRGGHPLLRTLRADGPGSSPPTRGSSWCATTSTAVDGVVPAYAGVILLRPSERPRPPGRPRLRGGHPLPVNAPRLEVLSSPPTRGSSLRLRGPAQP